MEKSFEVGLINCGGASHVNAALQIFFHIPEAVHVLENDILHRQSCQSFLCATCALFKLIQSLKAGKCVAPSFFFGKWKGMCNELPQNSRNDSYEVFFMLIKLLREEHKKTVVNERTVPGSENVSSIPSLICGTQIVQVTCKSCGPLKVNHEFTSVQLEDLAGSIALGIKQKLLQSSYKPCPSCSYNNVRWSTSSVIMPLYLVVRVDRCTVSVAELQSATFETDVYKLLSCVVYEASKQQSTFTSISPDGVTRQIVDSQVRRVPVATFLLKGIPNGSTVTLIYRRKGGPVQQRHEAPLHAGSVCVKKVAKSFSVEAHSSQRRKVMQFPTTTNPEVLMAGVREIRSIGTQSDPVKVETQNVAIQNDLLDYDKVKTIWNIPCKRERKKEGDEEGDIPKKSMKTMFQVWTGLNVQDFEALYTLIGGDNVVLKLKQKYRLNTPTKTSTKESKISGKNRLLLFLIRLRKGLTLEVLSFLFNLSLGYAGEIFFVITCHLYETLKAMRHHMFPTASEQEKTKPKVMKPFNKLRIILDGVSMYIETPSNFEMQGNTWSAYKHRNVVLFIVGVSCNGATIFCSEGMEGSMSDKVATLKSDLLNRLDEGDVVMTDKGFELDSELEALGCKLVKPPIKRRDRFFTKEEEKMTRAIAEARIYVEHAMADIRDNALLKGEIPLTLYPILSKLVYIAAYLRNFSPQRIHNVTFYSAQGRTQDSRQTKSPEDFLFED